MAQAKGSSLEQNKGSLPVKTAKKTKVTENLDASAKEASPSDRKTKSMDRTEDTPLSNPAPLTPIERVKIMNDFASAAMDEELKRQIMERPNGKEIYDVFVMAMNNKISAIMDNDPLRYQILSEVTEKAVSANEVMEEVNQNLTSLANFLKVLSGSMGGARPPAQNGGQQASTQPSYDESDPRARSEQVRRAQQEYAQRQSAGQNGSAKNILINGI